MLKLIKAWLAGRRCLHDYDEGSLIHMGMGKVFTCRRCKKMTFI